jgi:hypothetical protein
LFSSDIIGCSLESVFDWREVKNEYMPFAKSKGKKPLNKYRGRWGNVINMELKGLRYENGRWVESVRVP